MGFECGHGCFLEAQTKICGSSSVTCQSQSLNLVMVALKFWHQSRLVAI